MNYCDAKNFMLDGDAIVVHGTWPMSKAIQWYTGEDVSHIGMLVWTQFGFTNQKTLCLIEAMEGYNVRLLPMDYVVSEYTKREGKIYWQRLVDNRMDREAVIRYAMSKWGNLYANRYQFILAISPRIRMIRQYFGRTLDTDDSKYHCSELMTYAYMSEGYEHTFEPAFTTPGMVSKFSCLSDRVELTPCADLKSSLTREEEIDSVGQDDHITIAAIPVIKGPSMELVNQP